jgi:hypothetical protein
MKNWDIIKSVWSSFSNLKNVFETMKDGVTKEEIVILIKDAREIFNKFIPDFKPQFPEKLANEITTMLLSGLNVYSVIKQYITDWKNAIKK